MKYLIKEYPRTGPARWWDQDLVIQTQVGTPALDVQTKGWDSVEPFESCKQARVCIQNIKDQAFLTHPYRPTLSRFQEVPESRWPKYLQRN